MSRDYLGHWEIEERRHLFERHAEKDLPTSELARALLEIADESGG